MAIAPGGSASTPAQLDLFEFNALEAWLNMVTIDGQRFAPTSGMCQCCGANLADLWVATGRFSFSSCPKCHWSFV